MSTRISDVSIGNPGGVSHGVRGRLRHRFTASTLTSAGGRSGTRGGSYLEPELTSDWRLAPTNGTAIRPGQHRMDRGRP